MKTDIILAGVGGQGILSIAATIGTAAVNNGIYVKQAEVHGMSQRGGDVQSHFRLDSKPIDSDLIAKGSCDIILSVEPMEALRYVEFLSPNGWIVTNATPYVNIPNYPDIDKIIAKLKSYKNSIVLDADKLARDVKSPRSSNIVMLGAATPLINMPIIEFEKALESIFGRKGEKVVEANIAALRAGRAVADEQMK